MDETIFLINPDGTLVELREEKYDSEFLLQKLLSDYPKLLAGSQINPVEPRKWILISREIGISGEENGSNRWSLDHLFIDQDGIPTLVEVKRSTDTRIRREVIGQILDYAANAVSYWKISDIKNEFERTCEEEGLEPIIVLSEVIESEYHVEEFWERVEINLKAGKVRLLIVSDLIPRELRRIIEFLNGQMNPAEILGIEIKQYTGKGSKTMVPRVVGQTAEAQTQKSIGKFEGIERNEESYFRELKDYGGEERMKIGRKIHEWIKLKCDRIWYGKGKLGRGSFVPTTQKILKNKKVEIMPFAIWTNGFIEIYFQHYKNRPPMDEEENKLILLNKLNIIEGVDISKENINSRPTFDLILLREDTEMSKFIEAFRWFYEIIEEENGA